MGFRWNDAFRGGVNGFQAGSRFGPYGMIIGTVAGAASGGYGKDIDKKVTGNSQSGFTSGLLDMAGSTGSGGKSGYGQAAGAVGNLFTSKQDQKYEVGYENNPAVLARKESGSGSGSMGGFDISQMMGGESSQSKVDPTTLMKLLNMFSSNSPSSSYASRIPSIQFSNSYRG